MTAHRRGQFVGPFGPNCMLSACCGYGHDWSKAPTFLPHLLSQINYHAEPRFVTINEKLILKIANPLLTSPKCAHSHLLLTCWPSDIDFPVTTVRLASKPAVSKPDVYCTLYESQKLFGLVWQKEMFLNQHWHKRLPQFQITRQKFAKHTAVQCWHCFS